MFTDRIYGNSALSVFRSKLRDYALFLKIRLASLVVFSAFLSYILATGFSGINWMEVLVLIIGGFLVTGASNGFNQIMEADLDAKMQRTQNRPIPAGRMASREGTILAVSTGIVGISMLWFFLNPLSGILGALAMVLYAGIYTPLKRITPFAVFVGAFPGAIPPMLGYVAATGQFGLIPGVLFAVQFVWQFPHFWAIAWKLDEDYAKAGFRLLPSRKGKDKASAFQVLIYSLFLIPISLTPIIFTNMNYIATGIVLSAGIWFLVKAIRLFNTCDDKDATKLMFASFVYLPVVQLAYLFTLI